MNIDKLVGNTPMIKINYEYESEKRSIYTKLENYNYSGSIKDRIALYIIQKERENGNLQEKQSIVEVTSGNTGISFSAIGALFGHPVHIFMPDWVSIERRKLIEMYGAHVHLVSKKDGGFKKALKLAEEFAKKNNLSDFYINPKKLKPSENNFLYEQIIDYIKNNNDNNNNEKENIKDNNDNNSNDNEKKNIKDNNIDNKDNKQTNNDKNKENKSINKNKVYISPFPIPGYTLNENIWDFVCDLNEQDPLDKLIDKEENEEETIKENNKKYNYSISKRKKNKKGKKRKNKKSKRKKNENEDDSDENDE